MRRNGALAVDYARRHGVSRSHDDADAIIRAPDIDAVYVATAPDSHRDYVMRCAAAGKPVVVTLEGTAAQGATAKDKSNTRTVEKSGGAANAGEWPEEFREALQAYFQAIEEKKK